MENRAFGRGAEDFLLALYQLSSNKSASEVRLSSISCALGVSRPAASKMAKYLSKNGLLSKSRYSKVCFTAKGRRLAETVLRRHRLIEVFLHDFLGLRGKELEEQAHALEHALSDRAARRLDAFLGMPKKCPHGNRIKR